MRNSSLAVREKGWGSTTGRVRVALKEEGGKSHVCRYAAAAASKRNAGKGDLTGIRLTVPSGSGKVNRRVLEGGVGRRGFRHIFVNGLIFQ